MCEKKLIRVELTYEDGETIFLEGIEADIWIKALNNCCLVASIHGMGLENLRKEGFAWKKKVSLEKK